MLKYVVVAVFSICALPCFVNAQSGSRGVQSMAAPVMATPMVEAPTMGSQVMGSPAMGSQVTGSPMMEMSGSMDMGSMSSDCGCGQPAPIADCGCGEPVVDCGCAPRTRKKLSFTRVPKQVTRCKRVCTTDCCGCPKREWVKECKTVLRCKLELIDVPAKERCGCCLGSRLKGMMSRMGGCGCKAQADDCGCGAPVADCGCGEPVADCGCGQAAPVADCGCGG